MPPKRRAPAASFIEAAYAWLIGTAEADDQSKQSGAVPRADENETILVVDDEPW